MSKLKCALFLALVLSVNSVWSEECSPQYDALGIPHQEVSSLDGLYFCFGFHHGRDRAWEMDYFRRIAQGRNAEVLGFSHLKSDLMMRLLDLPQVAERIWKDFPEDSRKIIQRYADGVNAGFKEGARAREFLEAGYVPERWEPVHTLMVLLTQSFDQTRKTFFMDYREELSKEEWGEKASQLFDHDGMPWENTILKRGEYPLRDKASSRSTETKLSKKPLLWASFPSMLGENSGSNNWVISSKKSKTGKAILANDPHLDLKTPLFWYWLHLKSPEGELIGASLPGVPVVASGTNGKVAWGLTNAYINTADAVFLEESPENVFERFRPLVWVKLGFLKLPFFFKSFEKLKSGHPVLPLELKRKERMVLRWSGFSLIAKDVIPMFGFLKIKDVREMDKTLAKVGVPSWNFVFADRKGEIGYRLVGKAYRHEEKIPFGVPTMDLKSFRDEIFLNKNEQPHLLNPDRGYIYTANNRHWPADAAFYGGRGYSHSFRGLRIEELLEGKHDVESFKAIQCDTQVVDARFFLPKLFKFISSPPLANWQMQVSGETAELSLYRRLMDILMEKWLVDEYALFRLLDGLNERQQKEIREFYEQAVKDVDGQGWSEFHRVGFGHLSNNENWSFSPEIAGVGDNHTVNPGTSRWNPKRKIYEQYSGASMRMIIEMNDKPRIQLTLPGLNRKYSEESLSVPWEDWRSCKYTEISF